MARSAGRKTSDSGRKRGQQARAGAGRTSEQLSEYRAKRDFTRTAEPAGADRAAKPGALQFVIQKHAASHLHFDLRLELDGVMKSWAVPRGPHADPAVKRLAMQVEDHPMEYNTFEGTIPKGEYGGGTVMLWDRGTYRADEAAPRADMAAVLRAEYRAGKLGITFHGERMRGSWALVRTERGAKPKWLFFKHRDRHARAGGDLVAEHTTSVASGRTMAEIAAERDRVWRSNRDGAIGGEEAGTPDPGDVLRPMRARPARKPPADPRVYEAWHGGERVLAYVTAEACALVDEKGRDRRAAFRDIAEELTGLARRTGSTFVLDGEIAAGTLHALDLLLRAGAPYAERPWRERRAALEQLFARRRVPHVRVAASGEDADALFRRAVREDWRGLYARDPDGKYLPGKRTDAWVRIATPTRYR